jgi:nucleoid DNA-binding protein
MTTASTLGYTDLIDAIADQTGQPRPRVAEILDALADQITDHAEHCVGTRLHPSIGILRVVDRAARSGTGPDGKPWEKGPTRTLKLAVAAPLQRALDTAASA